MAEYQHPGLALVEGILKGSELRRMSQQWREQQEAKKKNDASNRIAMLSQRVYDPQWWKKATPEQRQQAITQMRTDEVVVAGQALTPETGPDWSESHQAQMVKNITLLNKGLMTPEMAADADLSMFPDDYTDKFAMGMNATQAAMIQQGQAAQGKPDEKKASDPKSAAPTAPTGGGTPQIQAMAGTAVQSRPAVMDSRSRLIDFYKSQYNPPPTPADRAAKFADELLGYQKTMSEQRSKGDDGQSIVDSMDTQLRNLYTRIQQNDGLPVTEDGYVAWRDRAAGPVLKPRVPEPPTPAQKADDDRQRANQNADNARAMYALKMKQLTGRAMMPDYASNPDKVLKDTRQDRERAWWLEVQATHGDWTPEQVTAYVQSEEGAMPFRYMDAPALTAYQSQNIELGNRRVDVTIRGQDISDENADQAEAGRNARAAAKAADGGLTPDQLRVRQSAYDTAKSEQHAWHNKMSNIYAQLQNADAQIERLKDNPDDLDKKELEKRQNYWAKKRSGLIEAYSNARVQRDKFKEKADRAKKMLPPKGSRGDGKSPVREIAGYKTVGWKSNHPIHYGSHKEPGTYDVTAREATAKGKTLEQAAKDIAAKGYIVAVRHKGQRGITNDHLHIVDPDLSPKEANRIKGQSGIVFPAGYGKQTAENPTGSAPKLKTRFDATTQSSIAQTIRTARDKDGKMPDKEASVKTFSKAHPMWSKADIRKIWEYVNTNG